MSDSKAVREAKRLEEELTRLFGETSYQVEKRACRGKYRGHDDYSLVFGSGRKLYIGLDRRNYVQKLREHLGYIRYFRDHQAEYTAKVRAAVLANDTPFTDAAVDIMPYDDSCDLCLYAVVILSTDCGIRFVYRETTMHYALVSPGVGRYSFDACIEEMLKNIHTGLYCMRPIMDGVAS